MRYPVLYTHRGIPARFAGTTRGPFICIRPEYRGDTGLHRHELEHVRQWFAWFAAGGVVALLLVLLGMPAYASPVLALGASGHGLLYQLSRRYRRWVEVRAYAVQAGCYADDRRPTLAAHLAAHYGLGITPGQALALLSKPR